MKISKLSPAKIRTFSAVVAVIFALPYIWGNFTGIYIWLSPFVMLHSVLILKSFVLLNVLALFTLSLSMVYRRWFCRYLCPVGYGCDWVSGKSNRRNFKLTKVPDFSKAIAIASLSSALIGLPLFILLDPMAIFHGFFSAFTGDQSLLAILSLSGFPVLLAIHYFFPGIWCTRICPLGGLSGILYSVKKSVRKFRKEKNTEHSGIKFNRRLFISSGIGIAAGVMGSKYINLSAQKYIRPPSSLSTGLFNTLCIRCGNCIKSCPTRIIHNNSDKAKPVAWMTPVVHFETGYCLEDCNLCGQVCPSGAISPFSITDKKKLFMALAVIQTDNCLLTDLKECDRCKAVCKYDAIEILASGTGNSMLPMVSENKCVGCGACAVICPPLTIEMIPV